MNESFLEAGPKPAKLQRSSCRTGLRVLAVVLMFAGDAAAQVHDHLKCFKIRDERTFDTATVTLDSLPAEFGLQSCTVKARAKEFCVPADKTVTAIEGGTVLGVEGEELTLQRLCYKLKCPAEEVAPQLVSDQFGSRDVSGFKAVKLCTPAVFGEPPTTSTTTTTTTSTTTTLPFFDDTFDGVALDPSWSVLHPGLVTIDVSGGALHLTPTATGAPDVWFNDGEGPLVYKEITGDFDVTTVISTRDPAIPANPPPPQYRLAGILARDPASTPANSNTVHVALGAGSNLDGTSYEYKSTDDSVSNWFATPTASPDGELRLRRSGATVEMYWRADSMSAWLLIQSFNRPDLPATLQVGPMIYSVSAPASIVAHFDEILLQ